MVPRIDGQVEYAAEYHIQASHFNNQKVYDDWQETMTEGDGTLEQQRRRVELLRSVISRIHGHDFVIKVKVIGWVHDDVTGESVPYVVDDKHIEAVVMQWNNVNLSTHKDFDEGMTAKRATAEWMAIVLHQKIAALPSMVQVQHLIVEVHETPTKFARRCSV